MARRRVPIRQSELVRRFASRLREVRTSRGMTQADLGRQASVTPAYVSRLESGKVAPGIDMVERLAEVLGTTPSDLLPTDQPDPLPTMRDQARRLFDTLLSRGNLGTFASMNPILALLAEEAARRAAAES